jgi:hypothetical protein
LKRLLVSFALFLWIFTSAFQSLAINVGENPFFIYFIAQIFLLASCLFTLTNKKTLKLSEGDGLLFLFGIYVVLTSFTLSSIFEGVDVFSPRVSIDYQVDSLGQVEFGIGNIAQSLYLVCNILLVFLIEKLNIKISRQKIFARALFFGSLVAAASVYMDWVIPELWKLISPYFRTNEAGLLFEEIQIDDKRRVFGIFSEPSYAGIYLAACGAFFFLYPASGLKKITTRFYSIILISASIITTSFTAYICVSFFSIYLIVNYMKLKIKSVILIGGFLFILAFLQLDSIEISKIDSLSVVNRLLSDLRSFQIFSETYGLGVGLGSHRASSLFSTLLATIGLMGFFLFCRFLYLFFNLKDDKKYITPIKIYASIILFANMIACAELSSPFFWTAIVCLPGFGERRNQL